MADMAKNRLVVLVHDLVIIKRLVLVIGLPLLPVAFCQPCLEKASERCGPYNLLALHRWHKLLVLSISTSAYAFEILSNLLRQSEGLGVLLVEVGHQGTERARVFADEAGVTFDHAIPTEPGSIFVRVDDRLVVHIMKGFLAAVAADKVAVAGTKRAEIIILFLDEICPVSMSNDFSTRLEALVRHEGREARRCTQSLTGLSVLGGQGP